MYGDMVLTNAQEVQIVLQKRGKTIVVVAVQGEEEKDICILHKDWNSFEVELCKDVKSAVIEVEKV